MVEIIWIRLMKEHRLGYAIIWYHTIPYIWYHTIPYMASAMLHSFHNLTTSYRTAPHIGFRWTVYGMAPSQDDLIHHTHRCVHRECQAEVTDDVLSVRPALRSRTVVVNRNSPHHVSLHRNASSG